MSADLLRRAAALMRERAEEASKPENNHPWGNRKLPPMPLSEWSDEMRGYLGGPQGEHAASWHPAVAVAVADWLDYEANEIGSVRGRDGKEVIYVHGNPYAFTVARTYLGEDPS